MTAALLLFLLSQVPASAAPEARVGVFVGANFGLGEEEPLRFAVSDAARMRQAFVELSDFQESRAKLVLRPSRQSILDALTEATGRVAELNAAGRRVLLIFYFSGHGTEDELHVSGERVTLAELRERIA